MTDERSSEGSISPDWKKSSDACREMKIYPARLRELIDAGQVKSKPGVRDRRAVYVDMNDLRRIFSSEI